MFDIVAAGFNGAKRGGMLIQHLTIINCPPRWANSWQKTSSAVFEALTARENIDSPQNSVPCATPYMPPARLLPDFNGMRIKLMQTVVGGNDIRVIHVPS
jgi:hypothetical protein